MPDTDKPDTERPDAEKPDADGTRQSPKGSSDIGMFIGIGLVIVAVVGVVIFVLARRGGEPEEAPARKDATTQVADTGVLAQGRELYIRYNCVGCHGNEGVGVGDLRKAGRDFPSDSALAEFIRDPQRFRPGISMPPFDHVVQDEEMPVLIRYVRELIARSHH